MTDSVNPIVPAPAANAVNGSFVVAFVPIGMVAVSYTRTADFFDLFLIVPVGMRSAARMVAISILELTNAVNAIVASPTGDAISGAFVATIAPFGMRSMAWMPALMDHYIWAQDMAWAQGMSWDRSWALVSGQKRILPVTLNLMDQKSVPATLNLMDQKSVPVTLNLMDIIALAVHWRLGSGRVSVPVGWHLKEQKSMTVAWHLKDQKSLTAMWNLQEQLSLAIGWYLIGNPELDITGDPEMFELSGYPEIFEIE